MALAPRRYYRHLAALAKIEAAYGTDPAPTGAANALLLSDFTPTPLAGDDIDRDYLLPWFGHQGTDFAGERTSATFSTDFAASGTLGMAPAWGPLLRACGFAETVTADTSVSYDPASADGESLTQYLNLDGVNHAFVGARGKNSLSIAPKQRPRVKWEMTGLLGPIADVALPAAVYTAWKRAPVVTKANAPVCTWFGEPLILQSLSIDFGQTVTPRHRLYEESVDITNRRITGSVQFQATKVADGDWFGRARARTRGALVVQLGTTPGNIITITGPAVEPGRPSYTNTDGVWDYTIPLSFCSTNGDDEISIVLT